MQSDREFLERHLEDWIERDPSLLGGDIRWASRQLYLPDQSCLDLLGFTNDGTWVVVELKAGSVGVRTVLQALHYFLELAAMTNRDLIDRLMRRGLVDPTIEPELDDLVAEPESTERDYRLLVSGVGTGEGADVAATILSEHGFDVPVQVVTFDLLRDAAGRRILLREIDEESTQERPGTSAGWSLESVLDLAEQRGVLDGFEKIRTGLRERGFRPYLKKTGLNFNLGTRSQIFWVTPREREIHIGYLSDNFPSLFGVDENAAEVTLGPNWIDLPEDQACERIFEWADTVTRYDREANEDTSAPVI